jgi:tape measure domain-containing protein
MADEKYIRIRIDGGNSRSTARKINNDVKGIGVSADGASDSMMRLSSVANAVITSLATAKVIQYADAWTNVNNRLRSATTTSKEFTLAQDEIIRIAQRAGVDLNGVAEAYSRISQATAEIGVSQERVIDVTEKLTLALKAGGATAAETSSVMIQFAQGLGSGALQGDELRSILEASIPITKALSKEFGVTTGELKKLGSEGKLTADRVVDAIENIDEKSLTFTKDVTSGFVEVNNALTVYVGKIDESLGASENLYGVLRGLSENIDEVVSVIGVFIQVGATAYITNMTKALIANSAAWIATQSQAARHSATLLTAASATRTTVAATWALTYSLRALKAALPFGAIFLGLEVMQRMLTATNDQIAANDRYAESTRKLNARLETRAEKERAIALRTAAEVNARNQDKLLKQQALIDAERLKLEQASAAKSAKLRGEEYDAANELTLFQITKTQNRIRVMEEEARRLQRIADKSNQAFLSIQNSIGGETTKSAITRGAFVDPNQAAGAQLDRDLNSLFDGEREANPSSVDSDFESRINREKLLTQALEDEVELRRALAAGEVNQRQFDEQNALNQVFYTYEQKRQAIIENETLNEEQRKQILDLYREQEILAEQQKLDAITNATKSATDERLAMQEAYNQSVQALQMQTFSNATALLNSLNAESKVAALAGIAIQTATAFIANKAATASAATLAYSSQLIPGDPTSPVRAAAAAAKATTLGSINGGLILAAGAAKGLGALGGGGGGSPSSGGGGGSSQFTPQRSVTQQTETQKQKRIIDLRGFENGGYLTKGQLTELLQTDDDVILASNNGQSNAQRTGLING